MLSNSLIPAVIVKSTVTCSTITAGPYFSRASVARRLKGMSGLLFTAEECASGLDSTLDTTTEQKPTRACHWAAAAGGL